MLYFDLDGVIAKYDKSMYIGDEPKFIKEPFHSFIELEADEYMHELFEMCCDFFTDETYIMSAVYSGDMEVALAQMTAKLQWLRNKFPKFDLTHVIFTSSQGKPLHLSKIKDMALTSRDILIDDFNRNLYAWSIAGGTAIKYVNGINHAETWDGLCISEIDNPINVTKILHNYLVGGVSK